MGTLTYKRVNFIFLRFLSFRWGATTSVFSGKIEFWDLFQAMFDVCVWFTRLKVVGRIDEVWEEPSAQEREVRVAELFTSLDEMGLHNFVKYLLFISWIRHLAKKYSEKRIFASLERHLTSSLQIPRQYKERTG